MLLQYWINIRRESLLDITRESYFLF